ARVTSSLRARRRTMASSIDLETHTVQVTTDAITRPINTAFTRGSAVRYMPQGVRSRGRSPGKAGEAGMAGTPGSGTAGAGKVESAGEPGGASCWARASTGRPSAIGAANKKNRPATAASRATKHSGYNVMADFLLG